MRCQQQRVIHVEASMLFCVLSIFTTSPSHFHSVNFSLTLYLTPAWPRLTDCLICSFMLSENCAGPSVGHCFGAECLTGRRKGALMGREENETKLFHFQLDAKMLRLRRTWGSGGIRSSATLRWESEKCTEKTHSRLPNTFHRTKRTVPGSDWWLQQQEAVQKARSTCFFPSPLCIHVHFTHGCAHPCVKCTWMQHTKPDVYI